MLDSRLVLGFYLTSLAAAMWVLLDSRSRLLHRPAWEGFLWGLGTAVALPVFLPLYLLAARTPDRSGLWGPAEMVAIAVFFIVTLPLVAGLAGVVEGTLTLSKVSVLILVQNLGFLLLAIFGVAARYRLPLSRLGLHASGWPRLAIVGLFVGGLMFALTLLAEEAAVFLAGLVEGRDAALARAAAEHAADPLRSILLATRGPAEIAWLVALLAVVVPIGEEVYFRGVFYGGLRNRWGVGWGVVGSTLFFATVHQQVVHFLPIAVLAVILALLYERTRSLLPAIIVHGVNNVIAILAHLYGWNL